MLVSDHLEHTTGLSPRSLTRWCHQMPVDVKFKPSQKTRFTLFQALTLDIAASIKGRGFPQSLAFGIAKYLEGDFERLIADEQFGVYVFAQSKNNEHDDWTFCATEDAGEALQIADECEGVALFSGRVLLQQSLERLTAAQRELDA
ncbi:MAG: hypothetical protein AAFQ28_04935 [Pseudomonadota bacterium]